jgi:hypothetical protein
MPCNQPNLTDDEILGRLLALNLERAEAASPVIEVPDPDPAED